MEREADRIGYCVMSEAGFDTLGFVTMFGKLQQAAGLERQRLFSLFAKSPLKQRTHGRHAVASTAANPASRQFGK